ncbi:hypothetical protein [Bacillus sp. 165]|uniref:hypothetical protein n=1 Tax=Bacillus sp. 165 TaxID=1529117 RepID=UPI001ADD1584|nr:hypothetical protein [Bacillus sp. 165]MBO9129658.1 hypothetical protein [Bacillus sp. 165]
MNLQHGWETSFLQIVQQSEFKQGASRTQLLFGEGEEVEEIVDDYDFDEILTREYDEELREVMGNQLFAEMETYVFAAPSREKLITFINGLGFHFLDCIVVFETMFNIESEYFTKDIIKKVEKRLRDFPYVQNETTIFDLTLGEVADVLNRVTDGELNLHILLEEYIK